jgi:phosphoglycolate phosphatase
LDVSKIRGLLFDKDGTLFDFTRTWESFTAAVLRELGRDETHAAQLGRAIGFDLSTRLFAPTSVVIAGTPREIAEALATELPGQDVAELIDVLNAQAIRAPQSEVVPLVPFLAKLRAQGYKLGVATNDAQAPARAHLASVGAVACFDFIAGFDSGFGGKPAPGQMKAFCAATGLEPESCAMVGDSLHDLKAGRAAGFTTVAVLTGLAEKEELAPFADVVLADIGHIPDWLRLNRTPKRDGICRK